MPIIELKTFIQAAPKICFDLSLDIDLHKQSMQETKERAISGRTSGQIKLGESVEWKAKHFGFNFAMTMQVVDLESPVHFTDVMLKGPFKRLRHQHRFQEVPDGTIMTDIFDFQSPLGIASRVVDKLFLENYMRNLLLKRNALIKTSAEHTKNSSL
jgi:ligand-binding SRPBCC domain-containing protein